MSSLWMIAYDISQSKIRRNISKQLLNYGQRIQYSVFECYLTKSQQHQLHETLRDIIEDTDSIRWYRLCNWCESDLHWQGQGKEVDTGSFYLL